AWGPWKAGLVADLVDGVHRTLAGEELVAPLADSGAADDEAALVDRARAAGDLVIETDGSRLALVVRDRPGLFARVAGTLTLHRLDVLAARIWSTDDGWAVESFTVAAPFGPPDWSAVETD